MTTEPKFVQARRQFERNTTEHEMTVLHDDGLYRHLRFRKPGTAIYGFDLITWPGHLTTAGDIGGGWTFARLPDMFDFFQPIAEPWRINPGYWAEKMPERHRRAAEHYSADRLREQALESISEWELDVHDPARQLFDEQWEETPDDETYQREMVRDFRYVDDTGRYEFSDTWEWDANDWDHHFLLACFAIVWGVQLYRAGGA